MTVSVMLLTSNKQSLAKLGGEVAIEMYQKTDS